MYSVALRSGDDLIALFFLVRELFGPVTTLADLLLGWHGAAEVEKGLGVGSSSMASDGLAAALMIHDTLSARASDR